MPGTPHSDETKAAVLAALLAGQSVSDVARSFTVSRATIRQWRSAAGLDTSPPVDQQKKADIGDLVVDYLRATFATLASQQDCFRDRSWLEKQSAADLAVLHGVLFDKSWRVLAALEAAGDDDQASGADRPG